MFDENIVIEEQKRSSNLAPMLALVLLLCGHAAFFVMFILPNWQTHSESLARVNALHDSIDNRPQPESDVDLLQIQIATSRQNLDSAAHFLVTNQQAEEMLVKVYRHAAYTGVTVTSLQAQPPAQETGSTYDTLNYRISIDGLMPNLIRFMVRIRELSIASVHFSDVSIAPADGIHTLTASLTVYHSSYADGNMMDDLPTLELPFYAPTPRPVLLEPDTDESGQSTIFDEPPQPTLTPVPQCEGAPSTLFKVGDVAVVDFRTETTLNILTSPRMPDSEVQIITRVRDGARLRIIDGPVCGLWNNAPLWYWEVEYGGVTGWAGEAIASNRWLCPETYPNCSR